MFKYKLDSRKKFDCPECGQSNKFVRYVEIKTGLYIDSKYGRCDREESCSYFVQPENNYINEASEAVKEVVKDLYTSDSLNGEIYLETFHFRKNKDIIKYYKDNLSGNVFLGELVKKYGIEPVKKAFYRYKLGHCFNGAVMFPYFFNNSLKSAKIISFNQDLHRKKNVNPMWLHTTKRFSYYDSSRKDLNYINDVFNICYPDESIYYNDYLINPDLYSEPLEPFKFCIPLFGWDLLNREENKDKTICLVESEKTAVICSIVFPEFVWVASGGSNFLQQYKFCYYNNRNWLIFPDLSINDITKTKWIESINKIKTKYSMYESFIDFMPLENTENEFNLSAKERGLDIADYILDYSFSCGEYSNYVEYMKDTLKPFQNNNSIPVDDYKQQAIISTVVPEENNHEVKTVEVKTVEVITPVIDLKVNEPKKSNYRRDLTFELENHNKNNPNNKIRSYDEIMSLVLDVE